MILTFHSSCEACGWEGGTYRTPGYADYALRAHSCDKQRAKAAAHARAQQRHNAVDRTPQPCHHKRTTHTHATHACYVLDKCRCHPCTGANSTYEQRRAKAHAYGRFTDWVDAGPARQHLQELKAAGLGLRTVAKHSGVSESTLGKIIYGDPRSGRAPSKRVHTRTRDKIMATRAGLATLAGGARIDGTGTHRRIQALIAIGWSQSKLANQLGYQVRNFGHLAHSDDRVTVNTASKVRDLYDQLWNTTPPRTSGGDKGAYNRSLRYAAQRGWAVPMAWDDDQIDNPDARPNLGQDTNPSTGGRKFHLEDVEWLLTQADYTLHGLAARLHVTPDAITHACRRADRDDLLDRLRRNNPNQAA